jgi:hypothetical protein
MPAPLVCRSTWIAAKFADGVPSDAVCNYMVRRVVRGHALFAHAPHKGIEDYVERLPTGRLQSEFAAAEAKPWALKSNRTAGYVRAAGASDFTAGNQTFVAIFEAG